MDQPVMSAKTSGYFFSQCIGLQLHVSSDTAACRYYHDIQRNRTLKVSGNSRHSTSACNGEGVAVLEHVPQAGSTDSSHIAENMRIFIRVPRGNHDTVNLQQFSQGLFHFGNAAHHP